MSALIMIGLVAAVLLARWTMILIDRSQVDLEAMSNEDLSMESYFDADYPNMYSRELDRREQAAK